MSALCVIALLSLFSTNFALFSPPCNPYYMDIKSVEILRVNREYLGPLTKLSIKKTGRRRYDKKVFGCLQFLKDCGPVSASMAIQLKDQSSANNAKFNPYMNNYMNMGKVCDSPIVKPFFDLYENKTTHGNCIFPPQTIYMKNVDMDKELHKGMDSVECGCFKTLLKYSIPSEKEPIFECEILTEVIEREDMIDDHHSDNRHGGKHTKKENKG